MGRPKFIMNRDIVRGIWIDLTNGLSRHDIMDKLDNNLYDGESSQFSKNHKTRYLTEAYKMMEDEWEEQKDKQREIFYTRLTSQYEDATRNSDRPSALKALDLFGKMAGLYDKQVTLKGNINSCINIEFGLDNNEDTADTEEDEDGEQDA